MHEATPVSEAAEARGEQTSPSMAGGSARRAQAAKAPRDPPASDAREHIGLIEALARARASAAQLRQAMNRLIADVEQVGCSLRAKAREAGSALPQGDPVCENVHAGTALTKHVFLTIGRDLDFGYRVAYVLLLHGLKAHILKDKPGGGQVMLDKFEQWAGQCSFAIACFTPDDVGGLADGQSEFQERARQNVGFEVAWFLARLGRERVRIVVEPGVELMSDLDGVSRIEVDENGAWEGVLLQELAAAGLPVSFAEID